jgi:hypothetical protein
LPHRGQFSPAADIDDVEGALPILDWWLVPVSGVAAAGRPWLVASILPAQETACERTPHERSESLVHAGG